MLQICKYTFSMKKECLLLCESSTEYIHVNVKIATKKSKKTPYYSCKEVVEVTMWLTAFVCQYQGFCLYSFVVFFLISFKLGRSVGNHDKFDGFYSSCPITSRFIVFFFYYRVMMVQMQIQLNCLNIVVQLFPAQV